MDRWSALPVDFVKKMDGNLNEYTDKVRFRCVCTDWQSTLPELLNFRKPQPPLLLIPYRNGSMCALYHPFEKKVLDIDLPEVGEKVFKGSDHGWIVTHQLDGSIKVVNPLSRVVVPLPPRDKFPDVFKYRAHKIGREYLLRHSRSRDKKVRDPYILDATKMRNHYLTKIVLSCSPTCKEFIAVAHYRLDRLAYCKAGDDEWRDLVDVKECTCADVTFCGGKLYVVSRTEEGHGEIYVCDNIVSSPELRKCVTFPIFEDWYLDTHHLVHSTSNGLVIVIRGGYVRRFLKTDQGHQEIECSDFSGYGDFDSNSDSEYLSFTSSFEVYKLDMGSSSWISMESLGDEIIFMGKGTQMGISSQNFTASVGNQIYFATCDLNFRVEDVEDCFDDGIFSFDDGDFKSLDYECNPKVVWPQPIWFTPNPY